MGILDKLLGRPEVVGINGNGEFELDVVGESHYQAALEKICGPRKEKGENRIVQARLILDDHNPKDKQAVRIEIDGLLVGHLPHDAARSFRAELKRKGHASAIGTCRAKIKGGWQRKGSTGSYGVFLDIPTI